MATWLCMTINRATNKRSKHNNIKHLLIRGFTNKGVIKLACMSTEHNVVDTMTTPPHNVKHNYFINILV